MERITERTLIPISLVTIVMGGIFWLSAMWFRTEASAQDVSRLKQDVNNLNTEVIDRLARIETKLDIMSKGEVNGRTKRTR